MAWASVRCKSQDPSYARLLNSLQHNAPQSISLRTAATCRNPTGEGDLPTPHLSACGCQVG